MLIFDPTFLTLTLTLLIMTLHSDELVIVKKLTNLTTPGDNRTIVPLVDSAGDR